MLVMMRRGQGGSLAQGTFDCGAGTARVAGTLMQAGITIILIRFGHISKYRAWLFGAQDFWTSSFIALLLLDIWAHHTFQVHQDYLSRGSHASCSGPIHSATYRLMEESQIPDPY